jgi:hypothetical protein
MRSVKRGLLLAVACACVLVVALSRKPHVYEFAHFWLGAKYFPELRYDGLYGALATSLGERYGGEWVARRAPWVRNLRNGEIFPLQRVIDDYRPRLGAWSPGRWREFGDDVAVLKEAMERYAPGREEQLWREVFVDHGLNFPPTWVGYVHPLTRGTALTPRTLVAFAAIDAVFLLAVAAVCGAIGGLGGAVAALVFLATASDLLSYATWSLCRLDWLAALAGSLLLLRRGRWGGAGVLWGLASALKLFPGPLAFLFATAWYVGHRAATGAARSLARFAAGWAAGFAGAAACATLVLTTLAGLSPGTLWLGYLGRVGLYAGEARMVNRIGVQALAEAVAPRAGFPAVWAGTVLAAALALLLLRTLAGCDRPVELTAALSLLFAPLLFSLNHYYYLLLALPLAAGGRELRWLAALLTAVNLGVAAAKASGLPQLAVLELESVAYSIALAAVGPVLAIRSARDSGTIAPAMRHDDRLKSP